MRERLRAKIHKATVTEADVDYVGSITVDADLMEQVGIEEGEKVLVVDNDNGERLETYAIKGERGSGCICMNGAAAHKIRPGDEVIIMAFEITEEDVGVTNILVDDDNQFKEYL